MADAESAVREEHRQRALRIFAALPPVELSWEETAAVGNRISSAATRAECFYALALHAATAGEWGQSEWLQQQAEHILKTANRDTAEDRTDDGSDLTEKRPALPEMLRWMRNRQSSAADESEPSQWFSEAISLAASLRHFPEEALYAVGRLLIEAPPFPEREGLYFEALEKLESLLGYSDASLFRNDLNCRAEAHFWNPTAPDLPEPEQNTWKKQKPRESEPAVDTNALHPRLFRKKFDALLGQLTERKKSDMFVSNFLKAAASRILHPIRKPVVEALFEAARRIHDAYVKADFSALVHSLALDRGDTPEARWAAESARRFARKAGVLPEYETEFKSRLAVKAGRGERLHWDDLKVRTINFGFDAALAEYAAEPKATSKLFNASVLFQKALATGDTRAFFQAFDLTEEAFAISAASGLNTAVFAEAPDWLLQIGRLPSRVDQIHLLHRIWNWHDWFRRQDDSDLGIFFVPAWAGRMAAAGEVKLALETVERLKHLEHRAFGYAELAIGCGLTRGDSRAELLFARFAKAAKDLVAAEEYQCGADMGVRRIAMTCAMEGDLSHLLETVELGKEMLLLNRKGKAHGGLLMPLLEALSLANRIDDWGQLLDSLIQSEQANGWHTGQMSWVISSVWEKCRQHTRAFTLPTRLDVLEKFCALMAKVRLLKQWGTEEATLLRFCLFDSDDIPIILNRFKFLSSCSPDVVRSLLRPFLAPCPAEDLPAAPDDQMLRWIATLCPYSDEASLHFVGHVTDRCLQQNDWSALRTLARECPSPELDWLENIADTVLADA